MTLKKATRWLAIILLTVVFGFILTLDLTGRITWAREKKQENVWTAISCQQDMVESMARYHVVMKNGVLTAEVDATLGYSRIKIPSPPTVNGYTWVSMLGTPYGALTYRVTGPNAAMSVFCNGQQNEAVMMIENGTVVEVTRGSSVAQFLALAGMPDDMVLVDPSYWILNGGSTAFRVDPHGDPRPEMAFDCGDAQIIVQVTRDLKASLVLPKTVVSPTTPLNNGADLLHGGYVAAMQGSVTFLCGADATTHMIDGLQDGTPFVVTKLEKGNPWATVIPFTYRDTSNP